MKMDVNGLVSLAREKLPTTEAIYIIGMVAKSCAKHW